LRHSCATLLLAKGVNVKVVSERLAHSAHAMPSIRERATAAVTDRFDEVPLDPSTDTDNSTGRGEQRIGSATS
jgi:integrase